MQHDAIPIERPGLMDAIGDPLAMVLWETIRRTGGSSLAELAGLAAMPLPAVIASVDRLEAAGLIVALRAGRGRKATAYRVAVPEIRVSNGGLPPAEVDALVARWEEGRAREFRRLTQRDRSPRGTGQKRGFGMDWAYVTDEEGRRITALLRELFGIVFAAKDRHARNNPDGSPPETGAGESPYAFLFEVAPVTAPALPAASVMFSRQPVERETRLRDEGSKRGTLSPREEEVAHALASGLTRPQVARRLGLSPYTVVSLTQRIYAKLKVRSRAELARIMTSRL